MKNSSFPSIFLLFFLIYFPLQTNGQIIVNKTKNIKKHHRYKKVTQKRGDILISFDTVFNAGIPYCILDNRSRTVLVSDATVKTLTNKDVIQIYDRDNAIVFELLDTKTFLYPKMSVANSKTISKFLVRYKLLSKDGINPQSLERIKNQFSEPPSWSLGNKNNNNFPISISFPSNRTTTTGQIVERNRSQMIQTIGNNIKQDFKLIGTYSTETKWNGSEHNNIHYVRYVDGSLCAKITIKSISPKSAIIITQSDNRRHTVLKNDAFFDLKDVLLFLVENLYL